MWVVDALWVVTFVQICSRSAAVWPLIYSYVGVAPLYEFMRNIFCDESFSALLFVCSFRLFFVDGI